MTIEQWWNQLNTNKEVIFKLMTNYYPPAVGRGKDLSITAPNAEMARRTVMHHIMKTETKESGVDKLKRAIESKNIELAYATMNTAWFTIPESTACWDIPGFRELVALLEDMPSDEELEMNNEHE